MTRDEALAIYRKTYISAPHFDEITDGFLKLVIVDSGVLFGTGRATRWLQTALGIEADGLWGNDTRTRQASYPDQDKLARKVLAIRFRTIADIVSKNHTQLVFLRGWTDRAATLLEMM